MIRLICNQLIRLAPGQTLAWLVQFSVYSSSAMKVPVLLALALSVIALNDVEARPEGRLINGKDAFYSYVASLLTERDGLFVRGGGSFLTQSAILTSGSMIHGSSLWYVNYGNESIFYTEQAVATRAVVPAFFNPETLENDIGIVFLDSPADPGEYSEFIRNK